MRKRNKKWEHQQKRHSYRHIYFGIRDYFVEYVSEYSGGPETKGIRKSTQTPAYVMLGQG
jgi:hypothetical protein